jgi:hypothetical protein
MNTQSLLRDRLLHVYIIYIIYCGKVHNYIATKYEKYKIKFFCRYHNMYLTKDQIYEYTKLLNRNDV